MLFFRSGMKRDKWRRSEKEEQYFKVFSSVFVTFVTFLYFYYWIFLMHRHSCGGVGGEVGRETTRYAPRGGVVYAPWGGVGARATRGRRDIILLSWTNDIYKVILKTVSVSFCTNPDPHNPHITVWSCFFLFTFL